LQKLAHPKILFPILLFMVLIAGCKPLELERQGITIVWGMRLNEPADEVELSPNLAKLRELTTRQLLVELPLRADSSGLPTVGATLPSETRGLLGQFKAGIHLAFCTTNEKELFPSDSLPETEAWFAALERAISTALKDLMGYRIERVVIAGEWGQFQSETDNWKALLDHLRAQFPDVPYSMGGRTETLDASGLAALSDELAIDYPPIAGDELKSPCRTENQAIAALAEKLNKPVFIFRANVMGPDPLPQIKNRLRFWPEGLKINGICMNTLYPKVPPRDPKTYYGMEDDAEALAWLKAYHLGENL
jgi:hypothetical protein